MKKILLAGLAGLILGCNPIANRELTPSINFGVQRDKNYNADFFVGREWYDRNDNNSMDKSDGYYDSEIFLGKERIIIIAEIDKYNGDLTTRIVNEKTGRVIKTARKEISGRTLVQYNFTADEIRNMYFGGEGKYKVEWLIGDEFNNEKIGEKTFRVEK